MFKVEKNVMNLGVLSKKHTLMSIGQLDTVVTDLFIRSVCIPEKFLKKKKANPSNEMDKIKANLGFKRIYQCDECINKYLHYSALYSHKKNKHNNTPNFNFKKKNSEASQKNVSFIKKKKNCSQKSFSPYLYDSIKTGKCHPLENFLTNLRKIEEGMKLLDLTIKNSADQYPLFLKTKGNFFNK